MVLWEWCSPGFSPQEKGERIVASEIKSALNNIGYELKPFDIVLIRTDVYKHYGELGYEVMHPGVARYATLWLINRGIKMMGIPHDAMVAELRAGIKGRFWESHLLGKEREYCQVERMANLDKIPKPFGFKVAVFPIKVEGASGGWTRTVALIEK